MSVQEQYHRELAQRGYQSDPAQLRGIEALDRCARDWVGYQEQRSRPLKLLRSAPDVPRGVYLHGGVGRGKSFLMDCFYTAVPVVRKTRLHFHEFMREVHRELA
ncbi:MAG: AFG1/ZapE family ATPase, partial [Ramlibacter sp.]